MSARGRTTETAGRDHWSGRWTQLALGAGLSPTEPVLLALSGGADSVYLLVALARANPRPRVLAVHVDHRLRGDESADDAAFCARACARLGIPFARREVELEADAPNLEARAREARYRALADEARAAGLRTILTGHHEDDALETLLLRWMRGSALPGLSGMKQRNVLAGEVLGGKAQTGPVAVVRPLLSMRREEVRRLLRDAGYAWREDSSNQSARFTRNRVRETLLPQITEACGEGGFENLRAFASAVESLEEELAARTAHLAWELPRYAGAVASSRGAALAGGRLDRSELAALAPPLLRRALWRLLHEGTGEPPTRALLAILEDDLLHSRETTRTLPGGWRLDLRPTELVLSPGAVADGRPAAAPTPDPSSGTPTGSRGSGVDPELSADRRSPARAGNERAPRTASRTESGVGEPAPRPGADALLPLDHPLDLGDGRALTARWVESDDAIPTDPLTVELTPPPGADLRLSARRPRPGDRFHPLGAPGSRPLRRFLSEARVPRALRGEVWLVCSGDEVLWVVGLRPAERWRARPGTGRRLRLELLGAARPTPGP